MLAVIIEHTEEQGRLVFNKVLWKDPIKDHESQKAVRPGVVDRVSVANKDMVANKDKAGESWHVFGMDPSVQTNCHMIWASSKQLATPGEHPEVVKMDSHLCFSWGKDNIIACVATFDAEARSKCVNNIVSGLPSLRLTPHQENQLILIKPLPSKCTTVDAPLDGCLECQ